VIGKLLELLIYATIFTKYCKIEVYMNSTECKKCYDQMHLVATEQQNVLWPYGQTGHTRVAASVNKLSVKRICDVPVVYTW